MWNIAGKRLTSVIMFSDFLFRFTKLHSDQRKILDHSNKFAKQITNLYESSAYAHELKMINDDGSERKPTILLEKLLEMKRQGITDESLMMDQINTFIIAVNIDSNQEIVFKNSFLILFFAFRARSGFGHHINYIDKHIADVGHASERPGPYLRRD